VLPGNPIRSVFRAGQLEDADRVGDVFQFGGNVERVFAAWRVGIGDNDGIGAGKVAAQLCAEFAGAAAITSRPDIQFGECVAVLFAFRDDDRLPRGNRFHQLEQAIRHLPHVLGRPSPVIAVWATLAKGFRFIAANLVELLAGLVRVVIGRNGFPKRRMSVRAIGRRAREFVHGLAELAPVEEFHELDHVAFSAAAAAIENLLGGVD
jgi:hypothetical protein